VNKESGYIAAIWASAALLTLLTFIQPGTHLWPGIDQAWAYGINYAFDKRLVMGRDIYFTFGPLGWLEHTRVVSIDMLYLSTAFSLLISLAMIAALLHFSWQVSTGKAELTLNMLVCIALIIVSFPEMQRLLILGYALVFLHWNSRRNLYLYLLSASIPFCIFIKFSYGAAAFSLWFSYLALLFYKERNIKTVLISTCVLIFSYISIWLAIYGSLSGAIGYLEGELYISSGNASAMAMNPENNWPAILIFYLAMVVAAIIVHRDRRYTWLPLIFTAPLFVWTKYTFAQEQALHFIPILGFAVFALLVFLIAVSGWLPKLAIAGLLTCACFAWKAMHTESVGSPDYDNVPHITITKPEVVQYDFKLSKLFSIWQEAQKERLQPLQLPGEMRDAIGNASVDVYPWELSIAAANNLNWHPRPAFQTYIAYVPFLDRKNSDFYSGPNAPEYIVWHHHEFQDVMNRYSLSSEPLTTESILRHYQLSYCEGIFCLWKHAEQEQLLPAADTRKQIVRWNKWIAVPENNGDIVRAKVFAKRTLLGKANLLAWKEGGIEVDYKLNNGVIKTHDLLIDNAVSGVWISPYVDQYFGKSSARPEEISKQQLQQMFAQPPAQGYIDRIEPTLMGQRLVGWAAMTDFDVSLQQHFVVLFSKDKAFLVRADKTDRSDVAAYFASQGKTVTPLCGFYEEIAGQWIPAGDYSVRFAIRSADGNNKVVWSVIADQQKTMHIGPVSEKNQVVQVRFRTTRPWAFAEKITMQWQQLHFNK